MPERVWSRALTRAWALAAALCLAAACASAPLKPSDQALVAKADAQLLVGCYDCLHDAHDVYARLAVGKARPLLLTRLFESDLLLTLRAKELALDPTSSFSEATAVASELPPAVGAARYLTMVAEVAPDDIGMPRTAMAQFYAAQVPHLREIDGDLAWLATGALREPVRQYVALALDCSFPQRPHPGGAVPERWWLAPGPNVPLREAPAGAPPLVRYRAGICINIATDALDALWKEVPAFTELAFFQARLAVALAKDAGPTNARALLTQAYGKFPTSPSVTYLDGNFNQLIGDCKAALVRYDETLALAPLHENALLGRTVCLTFVKRNDEAIQAATRMITLATDNVDQAYYWRAWNQRFLGHLPEARTDVEAAKRLSPRSPEILTLAGMIEHDQDDLPPAEHDLAAARAGAAGGGNCIAMWYLGLVHIKQERWLDSALQFEDSMTCYGKHAAEDQIGLSKMRARTDLDADFKAAQVAGFEAALAEDRGQQYAAAFNAANQYAHGGNVDKARPLVEIAAKDTTLADRVAELRKLIGGG